jgi:vacuolar iron transporter family protein
VAGVRGAGLSTFAILALGFANLAADGLSMAVGDYHGIKSEEAANNHKDYHEWSASKHAMKHGAATWVAFMLAGVVPLLPYLGGGAFTDTLFWFSVALTALALFLVGAARSWVTRRGALWAGVEMLLVGVLAGGAAFFAGWVIAHLVNPDL